MARTADGAAHPVEQGSGGLLAYSGGDVFAACAYDVACELAGDVVGGRGGLLRRQGDGINRRPRQRGGPQKSASIDAGHGGSFSEPRQNSKRSVVESELGYGTGLNANLCEVLEETLKHADDAEMEYSVASSPEWPVPDELRGVGPVRLRPSAASFLGAAARQLRRLEESRTREISGTVVALQSDASASDDYEDLEQVATILWEEQHGRKLRVRVSLEPADYVRACDAHKLGLGVTVTGRLEKVGKYWTLMAPSRFDVLPPHSFGP